ncbi:DNA-binding protein [Elizabethkingia meningoseptica]|uniref:DNA-binding protein n=1 Tax=Elizabethkingia meningoseptica TaxID=238 RepID=A0A1V3U1D6_ELIME|nr:MULTISPECIES: helix-turn-helix transcriptional regulator [Elizabethkingia]AQX05880.1 DNA-binding protein [Elizabethkingia meningoseptica]AQX13418.1 DNA-binding protein [Elizabethkingia meningoseptica]AQX47924.1 DNA-binding protein [Elizabethkingia meningoseptica]EOR28689.1 helix-turn-helix domain protein [Elizabethkingia meningoseptica ATCC 13253 = NBRC 12535]KUY23113.1 DNA-binding protein [Elizabethkingia meningoseptica]
MNIVGSKIKRFREEKGYKQEYMATELEISQSNYSRLEKDDNRLTVSKVKRIAEILNIPVAVLFGEYKNETVAEDQMSTYQHKEYITSLKEEIVFLRKMLDEKCK